ncbi:hypothetical protein NP026_21820, partial [Salmonella enterica]|nr:hypothetical protein [Salmonella enterica]
SLKTSIKTITYLSDIGCLEIQGASLGNANNERFDFELQCGWMPQFVLREMKTLLAIHQRLPQEGVASLGLVI